MVQLLLTSAIFQVYAPHMTQNDAWTDLDQDRPNTDFLAGHGRMGRRIRAVNWTSLGLEGPERWPTQLQSVVRMMLSSRQPICICWGPDLNTLYNESFMPFLGIKERQALGRPLSETWQEVWDDILPFVRQALSGKGTWVENMPLVMERHGYPEETYWTFSYSPLYDEDGRVGGFINIATEMTSSVLAHRKLTEHITSAEQHIAAQETVERQNTVLQQEMQHRIKNMLSMVSAIVSQTMRHAESLEQASETIGNRITALGRAQDILVRTDLVSADVRAVVKAALSPHVEDFGQIDISGPDVSISAQQGLGLSLAIHELATNAMKYGALANGEGRITLSWSATPEKAFRLLWEERGGPTVYEPTRSGFGSRLTGRIVAAYFNGTGSTTYDPEGVRFVLEGNI